MCHCSFCIVYIHNYLYLCTWHGVGETFKYLHTYVPPVIQNLEYVQIRIVSIHITYCAPRPIHPFPFGHQPRQLTHKLAAMVYLEPPPQLLQLLHESLPTNDTINDETAEILAYVATLASSIETYDSSDWISALEPYLGTLPAFSAEDDECAKTIESFLSKSQALLGQHDESSDEEDAFGGEQITDIRFSLAYGGKILLHQTKLRLRRGHVYALVGQNGVGKTSEFS